MEEKTTRHGNILFMVCFLFFLNQTTKKRKKEKGKQIVTEILKKQRCLLKNAVCFHLCGKT
jgi:hypothetical protein